MLTSNFTANYKNFTRFVVAVATHFRSGSKHTLSSVGVSRKVIRSTKPFQIVSAACPVLFDRQPGHPQMGLLRYATGR